MSYYAFRSISFNIVILCNPDLTIITTKTRNKPFCQEATKPPSYLDIPHRT